MLQPQPVGSIPDDTLLVAKAAIPGGNTCIKLRDHLGTIFHDSLFEQLFPKRGQPAAAPWRLALVTIMQFAEGLSDRDASEAVRTRIDWKYLLGLELSDPGFDYSILSRFRDRLIVGDAEMLLLERLLEECNSLGLVRAGGDARTDSTHILGSIRRMNRSELVGETLRASLNVLSSVDPNWMVDNVDPSWYLRYARRFGYPRETLSKDAIVAAAEDIGREGMVLLERIWRDDAPSYLRSLPAIETLRRCWLAQFWTDNGVLHWRHAGNLPPAPLRIDSPYDIEARYCIKRSTEWVGYKVHLTEVCSPGSPHLITNIETTHAHTPDAAHVARCQDDLAQRNLLPRRQFVDGSYIGSQIVLESRKKHNIELIGPAKQNWHRRQVNSGYDLSAFKIDWDGHFAICPQGKKSTGWWSATSHTGRLSIHTKFSRTDCAKCSVNQLCTKSGTKDSRKLALLPREEHEWLAASRLEQRKPEWKQEYNKRAGIEGTISQGVRSVGMRRSRYRGLSKTRLQNVAVACAINLQRLADFWDGTPPAATRTSTFARLGQWVM
jgi:transposase